LSRLARRHLVAPSQLQTSVYFFSRKAPEVVNPLAELKVLNKSFVAEELKAFDETLSSEAKDNLQVERGLFMKAFKEA